LPIDGAQVAYQGPADKDRSPLPAKLRTDPETAERADQDETILPGFVIGGLAVPAGPARTVRRSVLVGASNDPAELEAEHTARTVVAVLRRAGWAEGRDVTAPVAAPADGGFEATERRSVVAALRRAAVRRAAVRRSVPDGCPAAGHQAMGAAGGIIDPDTGARLAALRGTGSPLAPAIRRSMEAAFGTDLSDVRLHTGPAATELSDRLGAEAFTVGADIAFRAGLPDVTAESGQHLLAHELTHVVQNRGRTLSAASEDAEPAAGRPTGMAVPTRRMVRRVLKTADGQPVDVEDLIKQNPGQAEEIRQKDRDQASWTPVKQESGLTFQSYQPKSASDGEEDDWENAVDELLSPSSLPPTGLGTGVSTTGWLMTVESNPRLETESVSSPKLPTPKAETTKLKAPTLASPEPTESGTLSWADFKKRFAINRALSYLTPLGTPLELPGSEFTGKPASPVGYVANVLTIPKEEGVQSIIDRYASQAVPDISAGSFAMVIGVNRYRDLAGRSADAVLESVAGVEDAPFPCTVVPLLWDFNWNHPFEEVQAAYQRLSLEDQVKARAMEKENLVQSVIPYGSLREFVTSHQKTREYVKLLSATHKLVYVHLGDDDAASLEPSRGGPLMSGYTKTIDKAASQHGQPPRLVVGGYAFRPRTTDGSPSGDLDLAVDGELLTAIASKLDLWFRGVLAKVSPENVYPTEPNLAFLAADGEQNHLEALLEPDKLESKRLAKEASEVPKGSVLAPGLLYGRNANEGGKLRNRIVEVMGRNAPKAKGGRGKAPKGGKTKSEPPPQITFFDASLAIATASTRFTLNDDDRRQHDPSQPRYGVRREENRQKADGGVSWKAQIIEDLLTIKQSHIGVLTKELGGGRDATDIASDVMDCMRRVLLTGELPGKPAGKKASVPFLLEMQLQGDGLREPIAQLHGYFDRVLTPPVTTTVDSTAQSSPLGGQVGGAQVQVGGSEQQKEDVLI
jgi:hypothetical protein